MAFIINLRGLFVLRHFLVIIIFAFLGVMVKATCPLEPLNKTLKSNQLLSK